MPKNKCEWCNGTGQISFFKGVSRFLISEEECPECSGIGYIELEKEAVAQAGNKSRKVAKNNDTEEI